MNRLKISEIKKRRYEERQQKALIRVTMRSPIERPITYIFDKQNRVLQYHHDNRDYVNRRGARRVSLALLPAGYRASKFIQQDEASLDDISGPQSPEVGDLPAPLKAPKTCNKPSTSLAAPQNKPLDSEWTVFKAAEIISEWFLDEPCLIDPETAYGAPGMCFMDTVVRRLRAYKTSIDPRLLQRIQSAHASFRNTPQLTAPMQPIDENSSGVSIRQTPSALSAAPSPANLRESGLSTGVMVNSNPVSGSFSATIKPRVHFSMNPSIENRQRISSAEIKSLLGGTRGSCEIWMKPSMPPSPLPLSLTQNIDLDAHSLRRVPITQPLRREPELEIPDEGIPQSRNLRHPIWDTPEEFKTYYPNSMMFE